MFRSGEDLAVLKEPGVDDVLQYLNKGSTVKKAVIIYTTMSVFPGTDGPNVEEQCEFSVALKKTWSYNFHVQEGVKKNGS